MIWRCYHCLGRDIDAVHKRPVRGTCHDCGNTTSVFPVVEYCVCGAVATKYCTWTTGPYALCDEPLCDKCEAFTEGRGPHRHRVRITNKDGSLKSYNDCWKRFLKI